MPRDVSQLHNLGRLDTCNSDQADKLRPSYERHSHMEPACLLTSPPHRKTAPNAVPTSKASVLHFISATPFDHINVSNDFITVDEAITIQFVEALGQALISILIQHLRQNPSPKRLLLSSPFSDVRRSSQTGESTGDRPAFLGFGSSSSYSSQNITRSQITTVTLSIELI